MNGPAPVVVRRQDYTPPPHLIESVELTIELDPSATRVSSLIRARRGSAAPLRLHGEGLELLEVLIDGRALGADEIALDDAGLTLQLPARDELELRIVNRINPLANTALSGLYVSNDNFYTQCEAEGFRRITFFPDRPDVMARYRVTLVGDAERLPILLSNGNLVASGPWPAGADGRPRHYARWDDPFPKPSYLFAVVAGRLEAAERRLRTRSGREVLLQVWVEPGNLEKTGHAMGALERSIRWDEERFGLELDLDRFMIVATGDFNMGAMENKGLNIFNTKYVFAQPRIATDADFAAVEAVVGHEYFHNWTGNRVTCRDWFQLTLKEGLTVFRDQEFSADMLAAEAGSLQAAASARAVKRIEDVRSLRAAQFPEDAGPMAHPIRPDAYQEINNFYTMTVYEKGAEVVRMLQTLVGRDGFRRGMDLYFQRHDGQAVTCDDFVAAIADANGRDFAQFRHWYAQTGTPRLVVSGRHDPGQATYTLEIAQRLPDGGPPLHLPFALALLGPDGAELPLRLAGESGSAMAGSRVLELTEPVHRYVFENIAVAPVPSLLRDFSAPVIVEFPYCAPELAFLTATDTDPFNRWEAAQQLALATLIAGLEGRDESPIMVAAWERALTDESLDPAFRDLLLTLPGEGVIAEQLPVVDPQALRAGRIALTATLGRSLAAAWAQTHARLAPEGAWRPEPAQAGRRALRNLALWFWAMTGDAQAHEAAARQFREADNMTARQGALAALLAAHAPQADEALARFADDLGDEPLAMDKWFAMQAAMRRGPDGRPVLERVRRLMQHPAFSLRNPNKARALVGGFCNGNLAEFHHPDGSGYRFWEEMIGEIDPLNPQVAARLARAMDRWRRFTPDRQAQARPVLERVLDRPGLSRDVAEVVGKALATPSSGDSVR
jgi:aminopeptidase N